jgi:hypothetical protein
LTTNTDGLIFIGDLARLIEAPVEKLRPLVEHKYLRVVVAREKFEQTLVARPGQRATDWLKTMFQPVKMRPLIPLREVGKLWRVTENHVLKVCWSYRIPVYSNPVFGNLMSFKSLKSYARAHMKYHTPLRLDRAGFLRYYLNEIEGERWKNPPPYSQRLEEEIRRIAHLPEPQRTEQAVQLFVAFRDARTATECFRKEREISEELRKSERSIDDLWEKVMEQKWRRSRKGDSASTHPIRAVSGAAPR